MQKTISDSCPIESSLDWLTMKEQLGENGAWQYWIKYKDYPDTLATTKDLESMFMIEPEMTASNVLNLKNRLRKYNEDNNTSHSISTTKTKGLDRYKVNFTPSYFSVNLELQRKDHSSSLGLTENIKDKSESDFNYIVNQSTLKNLTGTLFKKELFDNQLIDLRTKLSKLNDKNLKEGVNEVYRVENIKQIGQSTQFTYDVFKYPGKLDIQSKIERSKNNDTANNLNLSNKTDKLNQLSLFQKEGYNVWHASDSEIETFMSENVDGYFSKVKKGSPKAVFFTANKAPQESFLSKRKYQEQFNVKMNKPLIVDTKKGYSREVEGFKSLVNRALDNGYDGVIVKNVDDNGFNGDVYISLDAKQISKIKSDFKNETRNISSKTVSPVVMNKIATKLRELGIPVSVKSSEDLKQRFNEQHSKTSAFLHNNIIYLNSDKATLDSPMHEYAGHIFLNYLKTNEPDNFKKVIELSLQADITEQVSRLYPELTDPTDLGQEVFSTLIGLENQDKLMPKDTSLFQSILGIFKNNYIFKILNDTFKQVFGINYDVEINYNSSLSEIMNQISTDLFDSDTALFKGVNQYIKENIKNSLTDTHSQEEFEQELIDMGLIQQVCKI